MKPILLTFSLFLSFLGMLIVFLSLLTGCGSNPSSPAASPTPTPTASPSISSTPTPTSSSSVNDELVGNWIDAGGNPLVFKKDGTATSNTQTLTWSIDSSNNLHFVSHDIEVDSCSWEILTQGGLTTPLIVTLDLACLKAGALKYTRAP